MPYKHLDLRHVQTWPIARRRNLVSLADLVDPTTTMRTFHSPDLDAVIKDIVASRRAGRPVLWMMGAHVIKCGLGPVVIDLMRRGVVTHVATNGAGSIHDLELALIGETSEDVATSIEDGSFGMAHETGALIHRALCQGAMDGMGYGEAVGRLIAEDRLPHRQHSVFYHAYRLGVPLTVHVTVGADIVHQHPDCDFGTLGWASGVDFAVFCAAVADLSGGVYLNFGSSVTGPEVFLKALAIARNLGHDVRGFTTANLDLLPLGDYRSPVGKNDPHYYYRPRKNIVNRPTSLGGRGYHIEGDHRQTIPTLHRAVSDGLDQSCAPALAKAASRMDLHTLLSRIEARSQGVADPLRAMLKRRPGLQCAALGLCQAYLAIARSLAQGGTLFLCGNGGSMADALHISGELQKSFTRARPLSSRVRERLAEQPDGDVLAESLESGLRAVVLGCNPSLVSAVDNDFGQRHLALAQELHALARPGDVLLALSTSGRSKNVILAASTARALGVTAIGLTGAGGGPLAERSHVSVRASASRTERVQEDHVALYHCLCEMLEVRFFGGGMQDG